MYKGLTFVYVYVCMCVCVRERECVCVYQVLLPQFDPEKTEVHLIILTMLNGHNSGRYRKRVCVYVCVCARARACVRARARACARVCVRESALHGQYN
jgi:hypothetical protein